MTKRNTKSPSRTSRDTASRHVSFAPDSSIQIIEVPSCYDYDDEQLASMFYTHEELKQFREEALIYDDLVRARRNCQSRSISKRKEHNHEDEEQRDDVHHHRHHIRSSPSSWSPPSSPSSWSPSASSPSWSPSSPNRKCSSYSSSSSSSALLRKAQLSPYNDRLKSKMKVMERRRTTWGNKLTDTIRQRKSELLLTLSTPGLEL